MSPCHIPRASQVYNLWTTVSVFFEPHTGETIKGITDPLAAAHNAFILIVAEGTLVANSYEGCGAHVAVAHGAFAIALVAESADCYA